MLKAELALVDAARQGEPGAVLALIKSCQPDLMRFARRTCSTTEDAEDAVQVALWRLYRQIGALRTIASFAGWLFRIVERECYRLFRMRKTAEPLDLVAQDRLPNASPLPVDLRLDLAAAIESLPAPYREVLILRDIHELTAPELAAQLGVSLEAVKSRLHRARGMVRERLLSSGYWLKDGVPRASREAGEP